ncbi:MAG: hypothetical protein KJ922_00300, partial [Nanoarchaeota archaeon]|nr:hypothetical protein [Nanoarchaeota archaeon]
MIKKIRKVLEELNSNNIEYCILRNYNFLLEKERELKQSERSIDMVVSKKDFTRFEKLMLNMGFVKRKPSFSHKHVPFFRIEDNLERISFDVQIENVHWNDVPYMDVLKNRVKNGFFYVPSVNDTVAMLIIHSILGKRRFKPEYQEIIVNSKIDDIKVTKILEKLFGRKTEIILHLARQGSFGKIINKRLHLFFALRHPYVFAKVTFRWIIWKKLFLPWPLISFIGPDGSGKSTTAKALSKFLAKENRKNVIIYTGRGRNQLLPIRKVGNFYKSKERKKDIRKQAKCTLKKKLIYTLWAPVFTADLLLRYLFVILPKRLKKHVVI